MLENNNELKDLNDNELIVAELEVEELEQRLEMSCTRCCIELN